MNAEIALNLPGTEGAPAGAQKGKLVKLYPYYFLICLLLLFFGAYFSKFNVAGPVYLHDLMLFLPLPLVVAGFRMRRYQRPYLLIIVVSLGYLLYSLARSGAPLDIILRQYMICGYFTVCFFYTQYFNRAETYGDRLRDFLRFFGLASVVLQVFYLLYVLLILRVNIYAGDSYYYFSPICVLGMISYGAYQLVYGPVKLPWIIGITLLLTTTGHSSAFLAFFVLVLLYYYKRIPRVFKIFAAVLGSLTMVVMVFSFESFTDPNAMWRLFYWGMSLKRILVDNLGVLGFGFGVPYADEATAFFLEVVQSYTTRLQDETESYLSPMHNSFITLAFHIGLVFAMVVLWPVIRFVRWVVKGWALSKEHLFIGFCVTAFFIWSSLNVVLELPHSTVLIWLVFFYLVDLNRKVKVEKSAAHA